MPKTKSQHKTRQINTRLTEQEYEVVLDAAERAGMSLAEYCRMLLVSPSVGVLTYKMNNEPVSIFSATADVLTEGIQRTSAIKSYGEEK